MTLIAHAEAVVRLPPEALARVVRVSHLPHVHFNGLHDLVQRLAHDDAVARRLGELDAAALAALRTPGVPAPEATALLLADAAGAPLPGVSEVIDALAARAEPAIAPVDAAAVPPWQAVVAVQTLVLDARDAPLPLTAEGHAALAALTRTAETLDLDPTELAELAGIAVDAGLLAEDADHALRPTPAASTWLDLAPLPAWRALARGTVPDRLQPDVVTDGVAAIARRAHAHWPLARAWLDDALQTLARDWARLGVVDSADEPTALGRAWLSDDDRTLAELAAGWPAPTDYAYAYSHLELLVPGLLPPREAARLRRLADPVRLVETHTYRIDRDTLQRALRAGETPASLRALLDRLLRGGPSQPLDYLLRELERAHPADTPGRPDGAAPAATAQAATTRPDAAGARDTRVAQALELVAEYHASPDARVRMLLEASQREQTPVAVTVTARGVTRTFELEIIGLGAGRLRGRTPGADLERSLPLAAVVRVEPIPGDAS